MKEKIKNLKEHLKKCAEKHKKGLRITGIVLMSLSWLLVGYACGYSANKANSGQETSQTITKERRNALIIEDNTLTVEKGTKITWNEEINPIGFAESDHIRISVESAFSNGEEIEVIELGLDAPFYMRYDITDGPSLEVYNGTWENETYRTIIFNETISEEVIDEDVMTVWKTLLEWLGINATITTETITTSVFDGISDTLGGFVTVLGGAFASAIAIFYADGTLTAFGTLTLLTVGVGLAYMGYRIVRNLVKTRG